MRRNDGFVFGDGRQLLAAALARWWWSRLVVRTEYVLCTRCWQLLPANSMAGLEFPKSGSWRLLHTSLDIRALGGTSRAALELQGTKVPHYRVGNLISPHLKHLIMAYCCHLLGYWPVAEGRRVIGELCECFSETLIHSPLFFFFTTVHSRPWPSAQVRPVTVARRKRLG